ncbi:hypothetical protein PENTCL1PPCAC_4842, partial [Pristionchus entomophagus]
RVWYLWSSRQPRCDAVCNTENTLGLIMDWTAVGVAVRSETERAPMEQLFANLQRAGLFNESAEILIVVDAADHSGSAGSALNALLVV